MANGFASFTKQLEEFTKKADEAMTNTFRDIVVDVGGKLITFSPVLTGRFRGNWQMSVGSPSTQSLVTEDKEGTATLAQLRIMAATLHPGEVAWIVNNLDYGKNVEFLGWQVTPPYQPVRRTLAEFEAIANEAIARNKVK